MKALIARCVDSLVGDLKDDARRHLAELAQDIRDGKWKVRIVIERTDATK